MKNVKFIFLCVAAALFLTGCGCNHEWQEASCETPRTCIKCGETEGEALGHDWIPADCEHPETCARCGTTIGEPTEHTWQNADCTHPRTCIYCGKTEGDPCGHNWREIDGEETRTCSVCGATQSVTEKIGEMDRLYKIYPRKSLNENKSGNKELSEEESKVISYLKKSLDSFKSPSSVRVIKVYVYNEEGDYFYIKIGAENSYGAENTEIYKLFSNKIFEAMTGEDTLENAGSFLGDVCRCDVGAINKELKAYYSEQGWN